MQESLIDALTGIPRAQKRRILTPTEIKKRKEEEAEHAHIAVAFFNDVPLEQIPEGKNRLETAEINQRTLKASSTRAEREVVPRSPHPDQVQREAPTNNSILLVSWKKNDKDRRIATGAEKKALDSNRNQETERRGGRACSACRRFLQRRATRANSRRKNLPGAGGAESTRVEDHPGAAHELQAVNKFLCFFIFLL